MPNAPTGLSRLFRSEATSAPPETTATTVDAAVMAAVARIVQLQLRQVPLDALTAEVLPEMLRLYDAPAGALMLYRREDATLTLAAARGLAVAGAETLDVLRWGDERGFEMPLRALMDRKVYLVAEPEHDAFARQLTRLDGRRSLSSVAAVPLHRWHLPVGVLLVLGGDTALVGENLLAPSFAYDVLALALSNLLWSRDERSAIPLPASDVAPPPLVCVPWIDLRRESDSELTRLKSERDAALAAAKAESLAAVDAGMAAARAADRAALEAAITAARDESRIALDAMVQELRSVVTGLETERQATADERNALADRLATIEHERNQLGEQLAHAERDRTLFASRLDSLEQEITRRLEAAFRAMPAATVAAPVSPGSPPPASPAAVAPAPAPAAERPAPPPPAAAKPSPVTPPSQAVTPPPAAAAAASAPRVERRVLESDSTLRDHIQTALSNAIPAGRGSVAAVNLFGCDAARLAEMTEAAEAGLVVVGYAADGPRGSRILGPLRCFIAPPTATEAAAAVDAAPRGNRRAITLSEDIDAFMAAKSALGKAGHSVSMACDEKQALDLLAILRPDTVLVDVRGTGAPAVEFLDALGPESGRILTILVHGDDTGGTVARMASRMLRPTALDVNELVKICRNALPDAKRPAGGSTPTRR